MVLLITDGQQTPTTFPNEPSASMVASDIKNRGIDIYAVGIGKVDLVELSSYVSNQAKIVFVYDWSQLNANVLKTSIMLRCPGK